MSIIAFLATLSVLLTEGWLIAGFFTDERLLRLSLALPLAALSNVLLFFFFTILHIPLSPLWLGLGHAVIIGVFFTFPHPRTGAAGKLENVHEQQSGTFRHSPFSILHSPFILSLLLLTNLTLFSLAHSLLLPTFSIDSFTNWTMRSEISFYDRAIAFDRDETRGMAKPQYPFLIHALQIAANQGQRDWSDRAANAVTELLSLSAFAAVFLMLRKRRGTDTALLTLTLILGIPLLSVHLAQGYGDIHLVEYMLLSLLFLAHALEEKQKPQQTSALTLSSLFILAAMWTKSEGLFFGFVPWFLIVGWLLLRRSLPVRPFLPFLPFLTFLPFLLLMLAKGLPLTPHERDLSFAWHPEGLSALWPSLFGSGSFGIIWYTLPVLSVLILIETRRKQQWITSNELPLLLWGWLIVAQNLVIYLGTPNVVFLLDGESFFRQMLPAAALIILACAMIISFPQAGTPAASEKIMVRPNPT